MTDYAILYAPDAYSTAGRLMGRQSAGAAFLRAIADHRPSRLWCHAPTQSDARGCANALARLGATRTGVSWIPFLEPGRLAEPGLLYRPDPGIDQHAWHRLAHADPRAYSLCGVTHTTASHSAMGVLAGLLTAPLEAWDAVICTSRAVRDSVRVLVETQAEYLAERLDARRFTLPQLPMIPLGVHTADLAFGPEARPAGRAALGLEPDETVVLFVGRLVFHGKAHPLPMYLALEECARRMPDRRLTLLLAGWYPSPAIQAAFEQDAAALCPSVRLRHVDGHDQGLLRHALAASDLFTSLADNIQETFGLTPIEAMAAGLPVVVSDWDGYRDTVREGVDGFRVPTLALPPGAGGPFADRFDMGIDGYDVYCGHTAQMVAVDVGQAIEAYAALIADPGLRRRMGEAGQARARTEYDWGVIFRRYLDLWAELGERRRSDAALSRSLARRRRPEREDPFSMFAAYPTLALGPGTRFRLRPGQAGQAAARRGLATMTFAEQIQPAEPLVDALLAAMAPGAWMSAAELAPGLGAPPDQALVWLAKLGVLEFSSPG